MSFEKRWFNLGIIILVYVLLLIALIRVVTWFASVNNEAPLFFLLGLIIAAAIILFVVLFVRQSQHRQALRQIAAEQGPVAGAKYLVRIEPIYGATTFVPDLVDAMVASKRENVTLRFFYSKHPIPITPFVDTFPPLALNETDTEFIQVEQAGQTVSAGDRSERDLTDDDALIRRVRRNLLFRGGWPALMSLAWMSVIGVFLFIHHYQYAGFILIPVIISAASIFLASGPGLLSNQHWLIVPGGLILRRGTRTTGQSRLHVFDRRTSVLCVVQDRRPPWMVQVGDGHEQHTILATEKETQMLLRAWLSPLAPPPVEKLVDLQ